jgi:tetratricopeptide (TPR) repeat protein
LLSAAGMFGLLWYSRKIFPDAHHLPPDFNGRLHVLAPSFAAFVAALFCTFAAAFLWSDWEAAIAQRRAEATGERLPARARLPRRTRMLLRAAYVLTASVMVSVPYINVLWPARARAIGLAGAIGFAVIVSLGMVASYHGQTTHFARGLDDVGRPREPWKISTGLLMGASFLFLLGCVWLIHLAAKAIAPAHERTVMGVSIALLACALGIFVDVLLKQKPPPQTSVVLKVNGEPVQTLDAADPETRAAARRKIRKKIAFFAFETVVALIMASPIPEWARTAIFYGHIGLLFLLFLALRRLRYWIYKVGHRGQFDRALRFNRLAMQIPGYGDSLEGSILFNAGRYHEARAFLKPLAFDAKGQPRLRSLQLYTYALALVNDGELEEAEKLLQAAVYESPHSNSMKVALASCLLTQEKEAGRACRLLEDVMAVRETGTPRYGARSDAAKRTARYAWALASCGRRDEARAKIEQALAEGAGLEARDQAGVHYFVGEAWRMLGLANEARNAYEEALRLSPAGVVALSAQKGLAKVGNKWAEWKTVS